MELEDWIVLAFWFVIDGIRKFKYLVLATIIAVGLLIWVASITEGEKQACRDKGGVPIASEDGGVKCTAGLIK